MFVSGHENGMRNQTFGWKHSTHRLITEKVVNRCNLFLSGADELNYEILKYSCIEPDFSRKNITKYVHGHFADIDNPSFNPPDALQLTKIYTKKATEAHKMGLVKKRDDYLGYALHFLQDMLNPVHVVFVPAPKGHPERIMHKDFENIAAEIQENILSETNLTFAPEGESFFQETLPRAMRTAKIQLNYLKKDGSDRQKIAKAALQNTYLTTNSYLESFIRNLNIPTLLGKSPAKPLNYALYA